MKSMKTFLQTILGGLAVDYAEIRVEETERAGIVFRGPDLDSIGRSFERGGCLRVFHRGNWGVATFNRIDDSLKDLAREIATQIESLPSRPEELPNLGPIEDSVRIPSDVDPRQVPLSAKHSLIRHYNQILLGTEGIATTVSVYRDAYRSVWFYSVDDRYVEQESVDMGFACNAVAKDGANIQSYTESFGKPQGFESMKNRESLVESVSRTALDLLDAEPVQAGKYTVIIDPLLAGVFVHEAFGHLSEADHIADNERLKELMKKGTRFGVDELTMVDDATLEGERGSYRYDDEGTEGQRTELVKQGVLAEHLHDRQSAGRMRESPTGNGRAVSYRFPPIVRMSNTFIEPRAAKLEAMLDSTSNGLYVVGSRGGMTELESFTFSSQYAYLVENGRKTRMVRDVTLSGNVFETLKNIEEIGDDLKLFGGIGGCGKAGQAPLPVGLGAPHVKIRDVVIGGK